MSTGFGVAGLGVLGLELGFIWEGLVFFVVSEGWSLGAMATSWAPAGNWIEWT